MLKLKNNFYMKKIFSLIFLTLFLVSCADVGNKSLKDVDNKQVQATITEGKTTKSEIEGMFGDPFGTSFTDGGQLIYKYQYDDATAFTPETVGSVIFTLGLLGTKTKGNRNTLTILFDDKNIVKKFNMSNSKIESGTLIFAN